MVFKERFFKKWVLLQVYFKPGQSNNYEAWSYKKKKEKRMKSIHESYLETAHRKKVSVNYRLKTI